MTVFPYELGARTSVQLGLIVLQADQTIEDEFRYLIPADMSLLVSRVPSGLDVTPETLTAMETHLEGSAGMFPRGLGFDAVGYACTSGAAQIGSDQVAARVKTWHASV